MSGFVHKLFKSRISVSYSSMILLVLILVDFQKTEVLGAYLLCQSPEPGCLMGGGTVPLLLKGEFCIFVIPPDCGVAAFGVVSWVRPCICLSYPFQCFPLCFVMEELSI